jgi:hypothetical protein
MNSVFSKILLDINSSRSRQQNTLVASTLITEITRGLTDVKSWVGLAIEEQTSVAYKIDLQSGAKCGCKNAPTNLMTRHED